MTSCIIRRQAILTAFTNRWIWSVASRRPPTPPLSYFSRQHPILATPVTRSYSSRGVGVSYTSFFGFVVVPENKLFVIERLGKYRKMLSQPGLYFVIPFLDRVAFEHELRERLERFVSLQHSAVTKDNFRIFFDVTLHVKTVDVFLASYRDPCADHISATIETATKALQRKVSMQTMEKTIFEPLTLKDAILLDINPVMETWGIKCQDYHFTIISCHRLLTESKVLKACLRKIFVGWWRKICGFALKPHDRAVTRG